MVDPVRAETVLRRFARIGIEVAIDDFGAGYTFLAHPQNLPVLATVELAQPDGRRAYDERKAGGGKTSVEAMYRRMVDDAMRAMTGPGGHGERLETPCTGPGDQRPRVSPGAPSSTGRDPGS